MTTKQILRAIRTIFDQEEQLHQRRIAHRLRRLRARIAKKSLA